MATDKGLEDVPEGELDPGLFCCASTWTGAEGAGITVVAFSRGGGSPAVRHDAPRCAPVVALVRLGS